MFIIYFSLGEMFSLVHVPGNN